MHTQFQAEFQLVAKVGKHYRTVFLNAQQKELFDELIESFRSEDGIMQIKTKIMPIK